MLVVNSCLTRSATSSLFFDILFASICAVLDDQRNFGDDGTIHKTIPLHPTWWFYDFRMYTQTILLCYNLAKFIYEAQQNDMMLILSAIRCICVFVILARHHYYCRYKWQELSEGLWNDRFTGMHAMCMIGYHLVGAISAGVDPYFAVDRTAMVLFFILPVPIRMVSVAASKLYSKLTTRIVNHTVVEGRIIPPLIIFTSMMSTFFLLLCIVDSSSPWLADRVLMFCNLSLNLATEVLKMRKRVLAVVRVRMDSVRMRINTVRVRISSVYLQPLDAAVVVPVTEEAEVGLTTRDNPQPVQPQLITTQQIADAGTSVDANASSRSDMSHDDVENVEKLTTFTDAKRIVLFVQVASTFLVIISAELVLSMTLYRLTGVPTEWCAPFAFQDVNKGFQVVLDFFL